MLAANNIHHVCFTAMLILAILSSSATSDAGEGRVVFDVQPVVACHDVTTAEQYRDHPTERLIEVSFQISAMVGEDGSRLMEYFYRVDCQHDRVQVVDYEPKTTLDSRYEEKITIEKKDESSQSIGINVKGDVTALATASGGADAGKKQHEIVRYALRPPMETVAASGTLGRGKSVYFKLRSTPQQTLEGAKEFSVTLRVPNDWQADFVSLYCEARCREKKCPFDKPTLRGCASQQFVVSLFEAGNVEAEGVAEQFIRAERSLKHAAVANRTTLKKQRFPSIIHRVGAAVDLYEPPVPEDWLAHVLHGSATTKKKLAQKLPSPIRQATTDYWRSKAHVDELRGHQ